MTLNELRDAVYDGYADIIIEAICKNSRESFIAFWTPAELKELD